MRATWRETVQIGSVGLIGVTDRQRQVDLQLAASVEETPSIESMSNLCRNCRVVHLTESLINASKAVQEATRTVTGKAATAAIVMSSLGREALPVPLRLGNAVAMTVATITTRVEAPQPLHGLVAATTITVDTTKVAAMAVLLVAEQIISNDMKTLHHINQAIRTVATVVIQVAPAVAVVVTAANKIWDHPLAWLELVALALLLVLVHCSKITVLTALLVVVALHLHLPQMMLLLL